jgi:hypothetical protein
VKRALPKEEWDFSTCPNDELFECWFYEFTRQIPAVRAAVLKWRGKSATYEGLIARSGGQYKALLFAATFHYQPEWPLKPYLSISASERQRRRRLLFPDSNQRAMGLSLNPSVALYNLTESYGLCQLTNQFRKSISAHGRPFAYRDGMDDEPPMGELALLEINWNSSDKQLLAAFREWLKIHRPKGTPVCPVLEGGKSYPKQERADLKALGAYRLLRAAAGDLSRLSEQEQLYQEQAAWIKARTRAKERIADLTRMAKSLMAKG